MVRTTVELELGGTLGSGSFGEVRFGYWRRLPCAVKKTHVSEAIKQEIGLFRELYYKNIIQFYGTVIHKGCLLIVMEYADNGNLTHVIGQGLHWDSKLNITYGVICGLWYLHDKNILHRDLKSDNVLLTNNKTTAKLCDFGLSMTRYGAASSDAAVNSDELVGTPRWMAPELFDPPRDYTRKTDIYALGWIMWQLAANSKRPLPNLDFRDEIIAHVKDEKRANIPQEIPIKYQELILGSWHHDPSMRYGADEMLDMFRKDPSLNTVVEDVTRTVRDDCDSSLVGSSVDDGQVSKQLSNATCRKKESLGAKTDATFVEPTSSSAATTPSHSTLSSQSPKVIVRDRREEARAHDRDAQYALGKMHLRGKGIVHSDFEALYWFRKAADLGHAKAQFIIGDLYEYGKVLDPDLLRALQWYRLAAKQGHAKASERLHAILQNQGGTCTSHAHSLDDGSEDPDAPAGHHAPQSMEASMDEADVRRQPTAPADSDGNNGDGGDSTDSEGSSSSDDDNPGAGVAAREDVPPHSESIESPLIIGSRIGVGGIGGVYRAHFHNTLYAAKEIHSFVSEHEAIHQEIAALERLHHPHLIHFYEAYEQNGSLYLLMEYAERGCLSIAIESGVLGWPDKVRIVREIACGLVYLHRKKVLHQDLRSANVLLTKDMVVKLSGFDLAKIKSARAMSSDIALGGTIRWMAPEILDMRPKYSAKSDVFALGMVMWEMAAGSTTPFRRHHESRLLAYLILTGSREEIPHDTPADYRAWIEKCWEHHPEERPEASQLASCLIQLQASPGDNVIPESPLALADSPMNLSLSEIASTEEPGEGNLYDSDAVSMMGLDIVVGDKATDQHYLDTQSSGNSEAIEKGPAATAENEASDRAHSDAQASDDLGTSEEAPTIRAKGKTVNRGGTQSSNIPALWENEDARDLRALLNNIQQRSLKVKALPEVSKQLAAYCKTACDAAEQAHASIDGITPLYNALNRASTLLNNMSSRFFVWRYKSSLQKKIQSALDGIAEAKNALQPPQTEDFYPVIMESAISRELAELTDTLNAAERPQGDAREIFRENVNVIPPGTLKLWLNNQRLTIDEGSEQQVRFGHLYWARLDQERVLVKRVGEILGSSKKDTIKRVKALSHWMTACEGLMPVQSIQFPDLIIYGSTNAIPLDVYLTTNELNAEDKWKLAFKIASAVSFVHECRIIHRDIRAANVFMVETPTGEYEPKLAGFEICRSDADHSIGPSNEYDVWHAPEIRANHGTSPETDVFAFGVLMYEIAMGRPPQWIESTVPFTDIAHRVKENVLRWVVQSALSASKQYIHLIHRCLAAAKGERPTMVEVFIKLSEGF